MNRNFSLQFDSFTVCPIKHCMVLTEPPTTREHIFGKGQAILLRGT